MPFMNRIDGTGAHETRDDEADQEWKIDPVLLHDHYLLEFNQQCRGGNLLSTADYYEQFR